MAEFLNPGDDPLARYGLSAGAATADHVFAAGMALDLDTMRRSAGAGTIADETRICLRDVEATLSAAGCTLRDVVKTTCYISDEDHRREFFETYAEVFAPGPFPARTTFKVGIASDCRVEIDVVAARPDGDGAGRAPVFAVGTALDPATGRRRGDSASVADETRACLLGIEAELAAAGLSLRDVVKTTCTLSHEEHRFEFIAAYREAFDPGPYPARCTIVAGLPADLRVQVEAVADPADGRVS
jgi:2-iminobutanoate/2-iminopropanoate deaminase